MTEGQIGKKLAAKAIEKWGVDDQLRMLQEECAELIQTINHYFRQVDSTNRKLIEGLADVAIVHQQITFSLECPYSDIYSPGDYALIFDIKKGRLERMVESERRESHDVEQEYDGYY